MPPPNKSNNRGIGANPDTDTSSANTIPSSKKAKPEQTSSLTSTSKSNKATGGVALDTSACTGAKRQQLFEAYMTYAGTPKWDKVADEVSNRLRGRPAGSLSSRSSFSLGADFTWAEESARRLAETGGIELP